MKALRDLRRFTLVKSAEGNHAEIRVYVSENVDHVAQAFHVPPETIMNALEQVRDDSDLAARMLETIRGAEDKLRDHRKETRQQDAQKSADVLASAVQWHGTQAHLDLPSLVSGVSDAAEAIGAESRAPRVGAHNWRPLPYRAISAAGPKRAHDVCSPPWSAKMLARAA